MTLAILVEANTYRGQTPTQTTRFKGDFNTRADYALQ